MSENLLPTESYKGVRDFYPEDMAIQRFIFNSWSKSSETFGFERYDASILEPADLYKAKGSENEEMVNEQTYTFVDRGEREITLRPEMTPTVARLVAQKRRELTFPLRWYSIPNLFRYERPQRGRLREHWQLNCDIFGADHFAADVELISLAYQILIDFGATEDMFEIRINDRSEMEEKFSSIGITDQQQKNELIKLNDRKNKISQEEYFQAVHQILKESSNIAKALDLMIGQPEPATNNKVAAALLDLGIHNIVLDRTIARGFNYYTGTIFEVFDKHPDGTKRSMLGGGRYDNLTSMFSSDKISGVGFGMGDVTMRDFLETHSLLPASLNTAPQLMILPMGTEYNLEGEKIAQMFRQREVKTAVDINEKKIGKKIADAGDKGVQYIIVVGENELASLTFSLKNLNLGTTETGPIDTLLTYLIAHT